MSLNAAFGSERVHIGFFGCRNAGMSSVVNAVTGQNLAVVSDVKGTTTDPVIKAMELLPLGPVVIIDTPGIDDEGQLGELHDRITKQILNRTDIEVLVVDSTCGMSEYDRQLLRIFKEKNIPYLIAFNKSDLPGAISREIEDMFSNSAVTGKGIHVLKKQLGKFVTDKDADQKLVGDFLSQGDSAVLICPIDESVPKGRMILPQQVIQRWLLP